MKNFFNEESNTNPFSKKTPSYNNDNNIYNSTNINIQETPSSFSTLEYYMLSNLIISKSIKNYYTDYKSEIIPYSYIAFYIKEIIKYLDNSHLNLKAFLIEFNKKQNNLDDSINIFIKTFDKLVKSFTIKKKTFLNNLNPGKYLECKKELLVKNIEYNDISKNQLQIAIKNINDICETINKTSYDKNLKFEYNKYLSTPINKSNNTSTKSNQTIKTQSSNKKSTITPPKAKKEERVTRITIPQLKIGKIFPTSFTHSRIDSAYFVHKFTEGYKTFALVDKYRFNKVKYTDGFDKKRTALFEVKKSDFDLF